MALEFVFAPPNQTQWGVLNQGDVLEKTNELKDALSQAHPYYAEATEYTHFMVLTQSCDLVPRGSAPCRSRYVTLAAVRPLSVYVQRLIERNRFKSDLPVPIYLKSSEKFVRQALERLLHNTEDGFFFLKAGSHPNIEADLCVFLPLSVALRVEHYGTCLSAKIAQLDYVFQAKLGWLTGNIYARVGTPDLEEKENDAENIKKTFFDEAIFSKSAWLTPEQWKKFKLLVEMWREANQDKEISQEVVEGILSEVPEVIDLVAERAISKLVSSNILDDQQEIRERALNILRNDGAFRRLIKSAT